MANKIFSKNGLILSTNAGSSSSLQAGDGINIEDNYIIINANTSGNIQGNGTTDNPITLSDNVALKTDLPDMSKYVLTVDLDNYYTKSQIESNYATLGDLTTTTTNLESEIDDKQDKLTAGTNITIVDNVISASASGNTSIVYTYNLTDHDATKLSFVDNPAGASSIEITDGTSSQIYPQIKSTFSRGFVFYSGAKMMTTLLPSSTGTYGITNSGSFVSIPEEVNFTLVGQWTKTFETASTSLVIAPDSISDMTKNWSSMSGISFAIDTDYNRIVVQNTTNKTIHYIATLHAIPLVSEPSTLYASTLAMSNTAEKQLFSNYVKNEFIDSSSSKTNATSKNIWFGNSSGSSTSFPAGMQVRFELVIHGYCE